MSMRHIKNKLAFCMAENGQGKWREKEREREGEIARLREGTRVEGNLFSKCVFKCISICKVE